MNKNIDCIYVLVYRNEVLRVSSNLTEFYRMVLYEDIGLKMGLSTFRKTFKANNRFNHTDINGRVYWLQKIYNEKTNPITKHY